MSDPSQQAPAAPVSTAPAPAGKSLLEQMQELLASVNADLADLDSDLQAAGTRAAEPREPAEGTGGAW
ncbi:hypothetical protein [Kitasatospora viridis]|uniref:Uncharacterized protein n=1 Tax=Kitasatospora viridis TaxID=281105 RepID=A0A561UKW5_9ACTN|nr:hypothetical protein [Kitasatospora viridis]TWG00008.1 hypothetical protein FHX73_113872 [Kitasatospora viridis]